MIKVETAWLRFIEVVSVNSLVKGRITNYFAINKDLEIWILDKDENLLCSGLQKHWNEVFTYSTCSSISRHWEQFFQNRLRKLFPPIVASMFMRFKRNLQERYLDILG